MGDETQVMVYDREMQSMRKKVANFEKHLRIAQASTNSVEVMKHLKKAEELAIRYGFPLRNDAVSGDATDDSVVATFG